MDELTVTEWLEQKLSTNKEIDFLLTFMPSLSVLDVDYSKSIHVFNMLEQDYPDIPIDKNVNYFQFNSLDSLIQKHVQVGFPTEELLRRMSAQGTCKPVCDRILKSIKRKD